MNIADHRFIFWHGDALVHVVFNNNHKQEAPVSGSCISSSCRLLSRSEEAVKGGANCFVVRGVHRSEAETLDGLCSGGYEQLRVEVHLGSRAVVLAWGHKRHELPSEPSAMKWIEVADEENWDQVRQIFEPSAEKLRHTGFVQKERICISAVPRLTSNGRRNFTVEILRLRKSPQIFGGSAQPVGPILTMLLQRDRQVGHRWNGVVIVYNSPSS